MGCLLSLPHRRGNHVTIVVDSSSGDDTRKTVNIVKQGDFVIGWIGTELFNNLMAYRLPVIQVPDGKTIHWYLVNIWREELLKRANIHQILQRNNQIPELDGFIHIGYKGDLFGINSDSSVLHFDGDVLAVGSGSTAAKEALSTIKMLKTKKHLADVDEERMAILAVEAARERGNGVRGEIHYLTT